MLNFWRVNNSYCQCGLSYIEQAKRRLYFCLYEHKLSFRNQETNKTAIAKPFWENEHTFNFDSTKNFCKPNASFQLDFLEAFHILKNDNNVVNCDFVLSFIRSSKILH